MVANATLADFAAQYFEPDDKLSSDCLVENEGWDQEEAGGSSLAGLSSDGSSLVDIRKDLWSFQTEVALNGTWF